MFTVAAGRDGRIYLGGVGDFGWAERFGGEYVSLAPWGQRLGRSFGETWAVVAGTRHVYFVDREHAYRWDGESLAAIHDGRGELRHAVALGADDAIAFDPGAGLVLLDGSGARVLPGSEPLAALPACALAPLGAEVATVCSDGVLRRWSAEGLVAANAIDATLAARLKTARPSALAALTPDTYAVATRRGNLFLVSGAGAFLGELAPVQSADATRIFSLLPLGPDGLWVGQDHGLALVEWPGQVSRYDRALGLVGVPLGVARVAGALNLVTTAGVHRLDATASGFATAVPYALSDHVLFDFAASRGGTLFAATREGLYAIEGGEVVRADEELCYVARVVSEAPLRVLVGGDRHAWVIERDGGTWRRLGDLPRVRGEIRRITPESDAVLWLSSRSGRQLVRVDLGDASAPGWTASSARVTDFSAAADAPPAPVLPLQLPDGLAFAAAGKFYRHDPASMRFERDAALEAVLSTRDGELRDALPLGGGRVLLAQHDRYRVLRRGERDDTWFEEPTPLARVPRGASPRSLHREDDGTIWITTSNAIYRHRPAQQSALPSLPRPRIELLHAERPLALAHGTDIALGTGPRNLELRFSTAVFVAADTVRFRSRLVPLDRDWTAWTPNAVREIAHLPGGSYTLEVQAKDLFGRESEAARVTLVLERPWYRRGWAIALGAALLAAAVAMLVRLRERRLRARAEALESLVRDRTLALEAASVTDQLTGLHNRHYFDASTRQLRSTRPAVLVALVDVDHFKRINDTLGHEAGDRVLQDVAARLHDAAPRGSFLFRWGGEEFLLLAPLFEGSGLAEAITQRLLERVGGTPVALDATRIDVTCSIGWEIAPVPDEGAMHEALRRADAHLYAAKQAGRNRVHGPARGAARRARRSDSDPFLTLRRRHRRRLRQGGARKLERARQRLGRFDRDVGLDAAAFPRRTRQHAPFREEQRIAAPDRVLRAAVAGAGRARADERRAALAPRDRREHLGGGRGVFVGQHVQRCGREFRPRQRGIARDRVAHVHRAVLRDVQLDRAARRRQERARELGDRVGRAADVAAQVDHDRVAVGEQCDRGAQRLARQVRGHEARQREVADVAFEVLDGGHAEVRACDLVDAAAVDAAGAHDAAHATAVVATLHHLLPARRARTRGRART